MSKSRLGVFTDIHIEIIVDFLKFVVEKIFITRNKSNKLSNFIGNNFVTVEHHNFLGSLNFSP